MQYNLEVRAASGKSIQYATIHSFFFSRDVKVLMKIYFRPIEIKCIPNEIGI